MRRTLAAPVGQDFPFSEFLPAHKVKKVQKVTRTRSILGAAPPLIFVLLATFKTTLNAMPRSGAGKSLIGRSSKSTSRKNELLPRVFCSTTLIKSRNFKPIRPEFLAKTNSAIGGLMTPFLFEDTGTAVIWLARPYQWRQGSETAAVPWHPMRANASPNAFGAQRAYPGRQTIALCGDGGLALLALGDSLTQVERRTASRSGSSSTNDDFLTSSRIEQRRPASSPSAWTQESNSPRLPKTKRWAQKESGIEAPGDGRTRCGGS